MEDSGNDVQSTLTGLFVLMLVFGLSLLAAKDASKNKVPFIEKDYRHSDSIVWFFVCLLLSCLGLPYYLYRRGTVLADRTSAIPAASAISEAQLTELKSLKEKGLITEAEMEEKRRKILGL
jgi:hypothetical protein